MGKLTKINKDCLDTSKQYAKAYSYQVNSLIQPIVMYKRVGEPKYVYHIADIEVCQMRYVAEMIYAMLHEEGKKKIVIECEDYEKFNLEFYSKDTIAKIYDKLTYLDKAYFLAKGMN